jgi:hypothetical protein
MSIQLNGLSSFLRCDAGCFPYFAHLDEPLTKKISGIAQRVFMQLDTAWEYVGKSIRLTRNLLNATMRTIRWIYSECKDIEPRIQKVVDRLKLFSIVSVPLTISKIPEQIRKIGKSIQLKDREGVLLSTLSVTVLAVDGFDSLMLFVNAILLKFSYASIGWISAIGTPMTLSVVGIGSISRGIRLIHLLNFLRDIDRKLITLIKNKNLSPEELRSVLNDFLESRLGSAADRSRRKQELKSEIEELKEAVLERNTNAKTVSLLNSLMRLLEANETLSEDHATEILHHIEEIVQSLTHEKIFKTGYLISNMITIIGLILLFVPIFPPLPYILLALSLALQLSLQFYHDSKK